MGRTASGVKSINLKGSEVIGVDISSHGDKVLVLSEKGLGKLSSIDDYRITHRGSSGVKTIKITEKTGSLVAMKVVKGDEDYLAITLNGTVVRSNLEQVRECGRNSIGVKLIDLREKDIVTSLTCLEKIEDENVEENKELWHWTAPFNRQTAERPVSNAENYNSMTAEFLLKKMAADSTVAFVCPAVPANFGFTKQNREKAGKQFIDTGITEEHAIALVSAMAKNGTKPVFGTHSSFIQRTYDQLSQDLCINKNPATLLVNTASVWGMNDITHLGIFDIPLMSNIPELVYLAPTNCEEYFAMLDWSIEQNKFPVAIRMPCNGIIHTTEPVQKDYSDLNKYKITQNGRKIAILALGDFTACFCRSFSVCAE